MKASEISFSRYYQRLAKLIEETLTLCTSVHPQRSPSWEERLEKVRAGLSMDGKLRVTLLGAYSAGKSSLVASLTGFDVPIDADVATQEVTHYPWRGLELVDTPGVQADIQDTEHDQLAHKAAIDADLLLFVVSNELFTPRLAQHLHHVISPKGLGMARKAAIVVNKVDRETNPDEVIISEVTRAIGEDVDLPIWLCAARKALQARQAPEKIQGRFMRQSRIPNLVERIDEFVREAGTLGRLLTPIQVVEDVLHQAENALVDEEGAKDALELVRRQQRVLVQLENQFDEIRRQNKQQVRAAVQQAAQGVVDKVEISTTGDDVAELFEAGMVTAHAELDHLFEGLSDSLRRTFHEAVDRLDDISSSDLAGRVSQFEAERANGVAVNVEGKAPGKKALLSKMANDGIKPLGEALEQAAKNPDQMRNVVYNVGKKVFKHKFRPWEAVKKGKAVAKWAGRAGKALPFLATALDAYMNYREEKAKEERERHLARMRIALRHAFADQADVEAKAVDAAVQSFTEGPVHHASEQLNEAARSITESHAVLDEAGSTITSLKTRLRRLRREMSQQDYDLPALSVHSGDGQEATWEDESRRM